VNGDKQSLTLAVKVMAAINRRAKAGDQPVKPSEIMAEVFT
jgi:hypothetical protein